MKSVITNRNQTPKATTWAAFPGPTLAPIGTYYISDIGVNGSLWYNNGTTLDPIERILLQNNNKGWIVPSMLAANAATYSQSGTTLTVTATAHTLIAALNGADIYLVIGTVSTGVAPTAPVYTGWFTNFTYVDANTFTCTAGNSQTGTGAVNTNLAETTITELTYTLKGGLLGLNGGLACWQATAASSEASTKSAKFYLHTTNYQQPTFTTSSQGSRRYSEVSAANSQAVITFPEYLNSGFGPAAANYKKVSLDMTQSRDHAVKYTVSAALGHIAVMQHRLELIR
jgi:hypothetical protein